ncbi:TKL kinase [Fusarium mexicanum]|uniref:TKL kinase n=1 Tax=Fusarium mexicanum TaxID=751941 RepID=A0A8H5MZS3_9HYPO|nr:TKL kinase [Fusarium mexicanum]
MSALEEKPRESGIGQTTYTPAQQSLANTVTTFICGAEEFILAQGSVSECASDREAAHAIRARLEPLGRTGLSIVYTEKGNSKSALKAAGFWLDGEIVKLLYMKLSAYILKCIGIKLMPDGEEAWALRLERAPHGNLREYIGKNEPPTMARRLQVAIDFTEALQHVHDRGVIWGDVSPRNVLVFDDLHIKLCDFAGSILKDKFPDLLFTCEPRCWVPGPEGDSPTQNILEKELFALEIEELQQKLMDGEYPYVGDSNPVKDVIKNLWHFEHSSAQEVVEALKKALVN